MATGSLSPMDLRSAIERREILPYFQPVAELRTGMVRGFEVLARWQHPERGLVSPADFLPLAESAGLMDEIFDVVTLLAFTSLPACSPGNISLSVNVTPAQIQNRAMAAKILSLAERTGFPIRQLIVEITENALAENIETSFAVATELKAHGVRIALDDFGSGYSSLRRLNKFPLDEIKIDQSFVKPMDQRKETHKIAAAIAGLGHSLGLTVVAEGVEDRHHADILAYLGCELGQGWLYGHPAPAEDLPAIISKNILAPPAGSAQLASEMAAHMEASPALRLSHLQAIYDGVPVGLAFLDRDLRYISYNKLFGEISTAPFGLRLGRTLDETAPIIALQLEPFLKRVLNGEAISNIEILAERPGFPAEIDPQLISLCPVRDDTGDVAGISVAVTDIATQKRLTRMLREDQDHYRLNMELNATYPYRADPNGNVVWVGTRGITGRSVRQMMQSNWQDAVHPEDLESAITDWTACVRSGSPFEHEFRIRGMDGSWHRVRARATPRRDSNDKIIGWYGLAEDLDSNKPKTAPETPLAATPPISRQ